MVVCASFARETLGNMNGDDKNLHLFEAPFKALKIAFFITFLEVKYFLTSAYIHLEASEIHPRVHPPDFPGQGLVEMRGCGFEGKLFEQEWMWDSGFKGEAAIVNSLKKRREEKDLEIKEASQATLLGCIISFEITDHLFFFDGAFWIAFFTFFLEAKYFAPSIVKAVSDPLVLRIAD
ncbi:uncharacterized protein G2W53_031850 [Senna tora]|uniref:Uncharacterized protein n=1 Tax=Senna tora TaxID=362788 RepID=A0A834WB93_9FABA|nr:uncharacterized protein G2W53_031850 [Senna tora]